MIELEAAQYRRRDVLARIRVHEYSQTDAACGSDTLIFDSVFEGGNLQRAERILRLTPKSVTASRKPQQEYKLLVHPDIGPTGSGFTSKCAMGGQA